MGGKAWKCFRKNSFLYFYTAAYAVSISSFQWVLLWPWSLWVDGGCKRHTQIQQKWNFISSRAQPWLMLMEVNEYSAVLILHATSGMLMLAVYHFPYVRLLHSCRSCKGSTFTLHCGFPYFQGLENSHLATVTWDQLNLQQLQYCLPGLIIIRPQKYD